MTATIASERCLEFVQAQARLMNRRPGRGAPPRPGVVTISRQAGSGAHFAAAELITTLQARASGSAVPWKVFDRDLVERVLQEHDLPERMAAFMPEDRMSAVSDTLDELFGLRPSSQSLVRKTADTILHLAELGNVVIIGRAGNVITRHLADAFHVRLVGSLERRISHVQDKHLDREAASEYLREQDQGRRRYVEKYYSQDIDDPLMYHLVINTDRLPYGEAGRLIADAVDGRSEQTAVDRHRSQNGINEPAASVS
jgi:cytidylate kinase